MKSFLLTLPIFLMACASHVNYPSPPPEEETPKVVDPPVYKAQKPAYIAIDIKPWDLVMDSGIRGAWKVGMGDGWKIELPMNTDWFTVPRGESSFTLLNRNNSFIVILHQEKWNSDLYSFLDKQFAELKKVGVEAHTKSSVNVNGLDGVKLIVNYGDQVDTTSWAFVNNDKAFLFSCGGPLKEKQDNPYVCDDVVDHLYLASRQSGR